VVIDHHNATAGVVQGSPTPARMANGDGSPG